MAVYEHWLGICIRDDTYTAIPNEAVQFRFKTGAEICIFKIVNTSVESILRRKRSHAATACAKMRLVVRTIEKVCNTWLLRHCAKKATHTSVMYRLSF